MKKLFSPKIYTKNIDIVLLVIRVSIALLMLVHGVPKLVKLLSSEAIQFPSVLGMSAEVSLFLAVFAEVFCSILVLVGFGTRLAVIPLIITMLVASFIIHSADPFSVKELSLHYLLVYITLLITGSGRFSVDQIFYRRKELEKNISE